MEQDFFERTDWGIFRETACQGTVQTIIEVYTESEWLSLYVSRCPGCTPPPPDDASPRTDCVSGVGVT